MKINNRRYIGCKTKLLDFIFQTVNEYKLPSPAVFADIFAGTGAVASFFADHGYKTIVNDTLYSNVIAYKAWLGRGDVDQDKIQDFISHMNTIEPGSLSENYFSDIYGGKYYSINDAKKIGYIRECIEDNKSRFTDREYACLLASLIYCADKIANTVGHFESYLLKTPIDKGVSLQVLDLPHEIIPADIYNEDANLLVRNIKCDIAYIDPPYNARQYVNFYHVLENLARWQKPTEFEGRSMKFKRQELKSDYCRGKAPSLMEDLINHLDAKLIVVSYNNTYSAGSISSVNTISAEQLVEILSRKGTVTVKERAYRTFNAGKTELEGHKELLYVCEVK